MAYKRYSTKAERDAKFLAMAVAAYPDMHPRAARNAYWIEKHCVFTKGNDAGKPFKLLDFQLETLNEIFSVPIGEPLVITRVLISMARKNGKTELCSALVLLHLLGPESVPASVIICAAAASRDQARIVWEGAKTMITMSKTISKLYTAKGPAKLIHITETHIRFTHVTDTGATSYSYCKTVSTSERGIQGALPKVYVFDEIAELDEGKRGLYDGLNFGQQEGGIGYIITTRSTNPRSLFNIIYNQVKQWKDDGIGDNWYVRMYSADPKSKDLYTWENVLAANPAWKIIGESVLRADLQDAINSDSNKPEFKARRLNLSSGANASLVDSQVWQECASPIDIDDLFDKMAGERAVLGMDLGSTGSLTSLGIYFPDHKFVAAMSWMAKMSLSANTKKHRQPLYSVWAEKGYLTLVESEDDGGMDYEPVAEKIIECYKRFKVISFRFDGWNQHRLWSALGKLKMRKTQYPLVNTIDEFIQGTRSYGEAIIEFEDMIATRSLKHNDDPVTNSCVHCCEVEIEPKMSNPLKKPVKNVNDIPNDAALAMLMAIADRGLYSVPPPSKESKIKEWYTARMEQSPDDPPPVPVADKSESKVAAWLRNRGPRY